MNRSGVETRSSAGEDARCPNGPGAGPDAPSARPATDGRRIVWLASWPRSGNTWMRALLSNFRSSSGDAASLNDIAPAISGFDPCSRRDFDDGTDVSSGSCTDEEADLLRPALYRACAARTEDAGQPLFYRVHDAFHRNRAGEPLFPEDVTAGAVYLVRNPLDIAVSWAFYCGEDFAASIAMLNDPGFRLLGQGCPQLRQRLFDWSSHVRSWTGAPFPVLAVRYEDLLADAAGQMGRVARFLRLEGAADAGRRRRAAALSGFDRLRQEEERAGFGGRRDGNPHPFFRSGKAGVWRRHLSAAQVREVVRAHGETMAAFGYDLQETLREVAAAGPSSGTTAAATTRRGCES